MRPQVPQLILDFEPRVDVRNDDVTLQVFHSEQEYFDAGKQTGPQLTVKLPRPFQETALMGERGWRQKPRPAGPAKDLGFRMWQNIPEALRNEVLSGTPGNPQRVSILSTHCGIDDIPWEWLNGGDDQLIAAMDSVRFLRLVPTRYILPPLTVTPPIRVLIVLTNPKDERLLQSNVEIDVITQGLKNNPAYQFDVLLEPRLDKLQEAVKSSPPHIIHYLGHSGTSGGMGNLILHDDQDGTRWLPAAEIARFLPSSVRLLCLSTCVTTQNYDVGGLAKFAHCGSEVQLPTTIVNQYALGKAGAESFWRKFYPALIEHDGNAVEAFHDARINVLVEDPDPWWCWASFSLVVRDGAGYPLRIAKPEERPKERFAAELQAQWSARAANNLATRMRSLGEDAQTHWQKTLADEAARIENFESDIEKS